MTIVTIITNANDHTVYFNKPIKNFQYIKLISCSLYNSWINLEKNGKITLTENEDEAGKKYLEIPPGHHSPKSMLYFFKKLNYFSIINSPQGILVFPNTENQTITELTPNLRELFDIDAKNRTDFVIKKFKLPHSYFIHCDLMDKTENLLNGKPSNLLAKFSIRGLRWPTSVTSNTNSHIKYKFPTSKINSPHQKQIPHIKHKFATAKAKSPQQKQIRHIKNKFATSKTNSPHQKQICHSKNKFLTSKTNLSHQNPKHRLNGQRSMNESYLQFSLGLHPTAILFLHMVHWY